MTQASCTQTPPQLIPGELTRAFPRAMLNIHPGLLPAFGGKGMYGERVHKAVIASGARCVGLSAFVTICASPLRFALRPHTHCPTTPRHRRQRPHHATTRRFSGPTVHFVDEGFDTGPILAQAVVPVRPTDTPKRLAARVLTQVGFEL